MCFKRFRVSSDWVQHGTNEKELEWLNCRHQIFYLWGETIEKGQSHLVVLAARLNCVSANGQKYLDTSRWFLVYGAHYKSSRCPGSLFFYFFILFFLAKHSTCQFSVLNKETPLCQKKEVVFRHKCNTFGTPKSTSRLGTLGQNLAGNNLLTLKELRARNLYTLCQHKGRLFRHFQKIVYVHFSVFAWKDWQLVKRQREVCFSLKRKSFNKREIEAEWQVGWQTHTLQAKILVKLTVLGPVYLYILNVVYMREVTRCPTLLSIETSTNYLKFLSCFSFFVFCVTHAFSHSS